MDEDLQSLVGLPTKPNAPASYASQEERAEEGGAPKRKILRRGDYVSTQIFQPHFPCAIEDAVPRELFKIAAAGSKYQEAFSNLAMADEYRQGVGISQFAQTVKHAIEAFRQGRMKAIIKEDVYENVKKVTDDIYPALAMLDGGRTGYNHGFSALRAMPGKSRDEVMTAAKKVTEWLSRSRCPFRAYLALSSSAGMSFAAQVEEKVARGYLETVGEEKFVAAAVARLSTAGSTTSGSVRDDAGLTIKNA